jgi:hypothetical protein
VLAELCRLRNAWTVSGDRFWSIERDLVNLEHVIERQLPEIVRV